MNRSKLKNIAKSSFIYAIVLTGVTLFVSGCSTPKVLENRTNIPPATIAPPPNANELENNTVNEADITIPMSPADEIVIAQDTTTIQPSSEYPTFPEVKVETIKYKVKKGDSFWKIARMYGVGMRELAAYNNMDLKKHLLVGEVLDIPPGGKYLSEEERAPIKSKKASKAKVSKKTAAATPKAVSSENGYYTVKPGDSLWLIAKKNNTTVSKLCQANNISKKTPIKVGQKLALPDGSKASPQTAKPAKSVSNQAAPVIAPTKANELSKADTDLLNELINTAPATQSSDQAANLSDNFLPHTVKEGDTWTTISEMYGVSTDALKEANPSLASEKEPKIGTTVNIPEE